MVCGEAPVDTGFPNCGRCEKCVRTLLELEISGGRATASAFPPGEITADDLDALAPEFWVHSYWRELIEPLRARGRQDLALAVCRVADRSLRFRDWLEERGWKGWIRGVDRRHLSGRLAGAIRSLRGPRA
jgi:hypothetical protein